MVTIKKISIGSAFRVGAVISVIFWAVFGLLFFALPGMLFSSLTTSSFSGTPELQEFGMIGGMGLLVTYVCAIPFYAIVGGLAGALYALVYNVTAGMVGGIEVELDDLSGRGVDVPDWGPVGGGKPKNEGF